MDTRSIESKRLHPVRAWICFALAMTLLWGGLTAAALAVPVAYENRGSLARLLPSAMSFTYADTDIYWEDLLSYLTYLNQNPAKLISEQVVDTAGSPIETAEPAAETTVPAFDTTGYTEPSPPVRQYNWYLNSLARDVEYGNLVYAVTCDGDTITGGDFDDVDRYYYGAGLGLGWIGGKLYVLELESGKPEDGEMLQIPAADIYSLREYMRDSGFDHRIAELDPDVDVLLIPNSRIIDGGGILSDGQQTIHLIGIIAWGCVALLVFTIALFIGLIFDRRSKWAADAAIGRLIGRIWIEIRLGILACAVIIHCACFAEGPYVGLIVLGLFGWFWLYCIAVDLHENGLKTFGCNIFHSIILAVRRRNHRLPLYQAMIRRNWAWGLPAAVCAFISFMAFGLLGGASDPFFSFICLLTSIYSGAGAIIFIWLYYRARNTDYADIAALCSRIMAIREGRGGAPLTLSAAHRLAPTAAALESIYSGIEEAVNERTRAERTKIEMVTNISHDLKTPLTSIVGYADLLAAVEGLPPEAADYVAVITQKSARLNGLIKDLFALSKATTYDLPLTPESLDLTRLCNQLLAEQADAIAAAPVTLVTDLPTQECPCYNDGAKLYRVFANLLENALRYSLDGSRVFFILRAADTPDGPVWRIILRNTSREYIDFTAEEILARFVRGDRNRTTEGNGLGLPIAKSFTELCGGRFELALDGDTFTVTVDLPQTTAPQT